MPEPSRSYHASPLAREHMPTTYDISLDRYIGRPGIGNGFAEGEMRIPADLGPDQPMRGFESQYPNVIDYIVRITHHIWEDRNVEYIADCYTPTSQVFDDYGLQLGNQKIIADTHHTTGAFSNIRLIADEIVWAGDDQVGYHTSHRTLIRGTNDGDSKYGPATGKDVDILVIANCVSLENDIFLEHVLYNNSSLVQQLGFTLEDMAERMASEHPAGWPRDDATWQQLRCATSPKMPISQSQPLTGFDVDAFVRQSFDKLWRQRDMGALDRYYTAGFAFSGASDRSFTGGRSYALMLSDLFQCFPDLELQMDEVYWMGNENDGHLTSERWSAEGTHTGAGQFGEPTGAKVQIWGITQHRIIGQRIVREWTLFNELDLMMQIAAARRG